jgi:hypothetical protein
MLSLWVRPAESQTPGGINEQALRELSANGVGSAPPSPPSAVASKVECLETLLPKLTGEKWV